MKTVLCISLPEDIRVTLQCRNPSVFNKCFFTNSFQEYAKYPVIVLPVELFIYRAELFRDKKILTFGNPINLEEAFLMGSSDYLKAPWSCQEFILRLNGILNLSDLSPSDSALHFSDSFLIINNKKILLTERERDILYYLYINKNTICLYKGLAAFTGIQSENYENSLFVYISRLKNKLKRNIPELYPKVMKIRVIYKKGYILEMSCV